MLCYCVAQVMVVGALRLGSLAYERSQSAPHHQDTLDSWLAAAEAPPPALALQIHSNMDHDEPKAAAAGACV